MEKGGKENDRETSKSEKGRENTGFKRRRKERKLYWLLVSNWLFAFFFLVRRSVIQNTSKVITGFTENIIDLGHARAHADICTLV